MLDLESLVFPFLKCLYYDSFNTGKGVCFVLFTCHVIMDLYVYNAMKKMSVCTLFFLNPVSNVELAITG